jgi:peptidoglycan/LPS O-acetylase OafA/YrhL
MTSDESSPSVLRRVVQGQNARNRSPQTDRNPNLDLLRGVAVLLVLGRHMDYFHIWTKIGWAGVDLFFVLSGFLISGLLFTDWKEHNTIDIKRFYIRRGFKIYPPFYVLLAVSLAAVTIRPHVTPFPVNAVSVSVEALFLQSYFTGIWGHTWSLAVEEHFYLVLPLILRVMLRDRSTDPFRLLPGLFMIVSAACVLMRIRVGSAIYPMIYLAPTHLRIDALLFGVLLGYWRHFHIETFKKIQKSSMALCIIVLSIAALLWIPVENPLMHTVGFTLLYLGFGFLLARIIDLELSRYSARLVNPICSVGYYSYSIYLWHFGIAQLVPRSGFLSFFFYVTAAIIVGILMAKLIEVPTLAVRDRLFPSRISRALVQA